MGNQQGSRKYIKPITESERKMCLGKTKHRCELAAKVQLEELRKWGKSPHTLGVYKCAFCDGWHCGNNVKNI